MLPFTFVHFFISYNSPRERLLSVDSFPVNNIRGITEHIVHTQSIFQDKLNAEMNKVSKKEEVGENESPNLGCVEHHLSEMPIAGDYASSELRTLQI